MSIVTAVGHGVRLARAGFVLVREGAFVDVDPTLLPPGARLPLALVNLVAKRDVDGLAALSRAIDRLGPSYVKMGQFLSTRPDIVGTKVALALESLQDRVTPMSREAAIAIIERAFGAEIDTGRVVRDGHVITGGGVTAGIDFALTVLAPGGCFVAKVFKGGTERELLDLLKRSFAVVRHAKPAASRAESAISPWDTEKGEQGATTTRVIARSAGS